MPRRTSTRHIKSHRTYEVWEAAEVAGVTRQTVGTWMRRGLRAMTEHRPYLILGADLKAFIKDAADARKRPLDLGEFYCLTCKGPQRPAFRLADYHPMSTANGRLTRFCEACDGSFSRIISASDLPRWREVLEIGGSATDHAYRNRSNAA